MDLEDLTDAVARRRATCKTDSGVYIRKGVKQGSRAYLDGLREGMVIRELTYRAPGDARKRRYACVIKKLEDVEALLEKIPAGANVLGQVVRVERSVESGLSLPCSIDFDANPSGYLAA